MKVLQLDESDKELGLVIDIDGHAETIPFPNNLFEKQDDGILFYYYTGRYESKQPYIYIRGNGVRYWIATDGYLYTVDKSNNLVIGYHMKKSQRWYKAN
jgi:hypothetical protein